jgi:hypothetical protein
MRTTLLFFVFVVASLTTTGASTPIIIDITTIDSGNTYAINTERMTPQQIEAWLRQAIESFGDEDPFLIHPDQRTPFSIVFDMLQRFKAAGVKHFKVVTTDKDGHIDRSLSGSANDIRTESRPIAAPPPDPSK